MRNVLQLAQRHRKCLGHSGRSRSFVPLSKIILELMKYFTTCAKVKKIFRRLKKVHKLSTFIQNHSEASGTDCSANSFSTARKTVIYGFSQNYALEGLAFLTNFCASMLIKLWKRCASILVTQCIFWAEKILLNKQKVAFLQKAVATF